MSEDVANSVETAVAAIRSASLRQLTSPTFLEYELLPQLGLPDVNLDWYPSSLQQFCGTGLQSFQQPNQFSRYLCHLARCKITSYLEIGVWLGGTFIITLEYLSRFNTIRRALAVDSIIQPPIRHYALMNDCVLLHESDSKSRETKRLIGGDWWDLALIDGDHSEDGCFSDYQVVRSVSSMIALHDIDSDVCPAVTAVWQRLAAVLPRQRLYEFTDQYIDVFSRIGGRQMGIGLIDLIPRLTD